MNTSLRFSGFVSSSVAALSLLALVACSSSAPTSGAKGNDTSSCVAADEPECLHGAHCSCDDVASHDAPAICTAGAWSCPAGYTRFQDCGGVPPGPECAGGGGGGGDGGQDAGSD